MSKERRFLFFGLIAGYLAIFASAAYADGGGFVPKEEVPPNIPYQRAFLSYSDGHELMVVQTKFEGRYDKIGWVVPLPNPPKIATFEGKSELAKEWSSEFFRGLEDITDPIVTDLGPPIMAAFFIACLVLVIVSIIVIIVSKKYKPGFLIVFIVGMLLGLFGAVVWPSFLSAKRGVEILEAKTVGDYDTKTIKATDAKALIEWLNENGFKYSKEDEDAFNSYISKGWIFVTAIINNKGSFDDHKGGSDDLLTPPLAVWFEAKEMVYPLVLTAMESKETEILLYTYSPTKIKTDERFELEYAGSGAEAPIGFVPHYKYRKEHESEPYNIFFADIPTELLILNNGFLEKFKGRLTPDKMRSDLIFQPAGDETPYRKHIYKW